MDSFDAKVALENAKISLKKLTDIDSLDLLKRRKFFKKNLMTLVGTKHHLLLQKV